MPKSLISSTFYTVEKSVFGKLALTETFIKFSGSSDTNFLFLRLGHQLKILKTSSSYKKDKNETKYIDRFRAIDDRVLYYIENT
jgi:hypothetical protein